jgi:hypothetical protein
MEDKIRIEIPILLIGFNRPDILRLSIAKLRESKPCKMYIACDGARDNILGEDLLVTKVRSIMENEIDWPCEKYYRYNKCNKGCELTVSESISWVLNTNDYVIVNEDDVLLPYSFLRFAQEMLYRYKNNDDIYQVTSCNYTPMSFPNEEDYTFSLTSGHIWGWATWKRAWNHFDLYVDDFNKTMINIDFRKDLSELDKKRFRNLCKRLKYKGKGNSTWDFIWAYTKMRDSGLTIVPRVHLSSNVGVIGLHSKERTKQHFFRYDDNFVALHHPQEIKRNSVYDDYHYEHWLKQPPYFVKQFRRIINFIKRKNNR